MISQDEMKRIASRFVKTMYFAEAKRGYLGEPMPDGTYRFRSPTNSAMWRVRIVAGDSDEATSIVDAVNMNVGENPYLRVVIDRNVNGQWEVVGVDPLWLATQIQQPVGAGVGPHSHRFGFGLEDLVEDLRFEPGAPYYHAGTTIGVFPFFYKDNTGDAYFSGGTLALASYLPPTSGKWAWVKVGLDITDGSLVAETGTEYNAQSDLTMARLAEVNLGADVLPLGGVQCAHSDTSLGDYRRFTSARQWLSGSGSSTTDLKEAILSSIVVSGGDVVTSNGEVVWTS